MNAKEKELIEGLVDEFRNTLIIKFESTKALTMNAHGAESEFHVYASCVADYYCLDKNKMLHTGNRFSDVKTARQMLWWLCRTGESALPFSLSRLGIMSGGFNHATVIHGSRVIDNDILYDQPTRRDVKAIASLLGYDIEKFGMSYTTKTKEG